MLLIDYWTFNCFKIQYTYTLYIIILFLLLLYGHWMSGESWLAIKDPIPCSQRLAI